jgi:hypothetical protein
MRMKEPPPLLCARLCVLLVVFAQLVPTGCRSRQDDESSHLTPHVSLQEIYGLGTSPTWDDVVKLLGAVHPTSDLVLDCPAEEGGLYFFLFWPTNEIPGIFPNERQPLGTWRLTAVLKANSINSYFDGDVTYVWPKRLDGKRCTGHGGRSWKQKEKGGSG